MNDPVIVLSKPIKVEGQDVYEITLREPTVKEMLAQDKVSGDTEAMVVMVEALAELPRPAVLQIVARDFVRCVSVVTGFLADGQTTGES